MITIGSGVTIESGISLVPVNNPTPTSGQVINIDAGDSRSFSGSGIAYYGVTGGIGAHDLSGHNNIAQLTNGVSWMNVGNASYFNFNPADNQYLDCNIIDSTPLVAGDYSYFAMVRQTSFDNRTIFSSNQTSLYWTSTGGLNNGPRLVASNNGTSPSIVDNTTEFLPGVWYGIAVTYRVNSGIMKLYVNGNLVAATTGIPALATAQSIYIGNNQGTSAANDGDISVALVYRRELTDNEVSIIYNFYSNRYIPVLTTSSAFFNVPGSYSWTCPPGVYSVSVLAIGAGGGGTSEPYSPPGGDSFFVDSNTCWAQGGPEINDTIYTGPPAQYLGDGGGFGGTINQADNWGIGGGGAGGYTGQGGTGSTYQSPGDMTGGAGGAGGGGGGRRYDTGAGGGGVGIYGIGADGQPGTFDNIGSVSTVGLGGTGGSNGESGGPATSWNGGRGGLYGGGGGSASGFYLGGNGGALAWINNYVVVPGNSYNVTVGAGGQGSLDGGSGAPGCVRIVWPGDTRQFPTTNVGPDQ